MNSHGKPRCLLANHTSFLDTILCVALCPLSEVGAIRMFAGSHLLKMPIIGSLIQAMGHMTVPFKACSADSKDFAIDKDEMAKQMKKLEYHIQSGCLGAWFPEGTQNRADPMKVQIFRAGGFAICTNVDCEIWCMAFGGNAVCWPPKAPIG